MTKRRQQKGQSMQILLFALVIVGLAVGVMSFTQVMTAPQIFGSTMDDVPVISEAQSRTDNVANYYVPLSAHYSMAQGVYDVGQANDIIMTYQNLQDHYGDEVDDVEVASQYTFEGYIQDPEWEIGRCTIEVPPKDLEVGINSTLVNVTKENYNDPFVRTLCEGGDVEVQTQSNKDEAQKNTSNIRFHHLMVMTINGLEAVHEESETAKDDDDYYGTVTEEGACYLDGNDPQTKEEKARQDARQESYDSAVSEILSLQERFEEAGWNAVDNIEVSEDENTGIFGRIINFVTFWETDNTFDWSFNVYENSTEISEQSNELSDCECAEYDCEGYIDDSTYEYDSSDSQCKHEDEPFGSPNCDEYSGVVHDGSGSCETSYHPPKCDPGYSFNSSTNTCESDYGNDWEFACDQNDYYLDTSDEECVHDNSGEDATCDSSAAKESGGDCVHDGERPSPVCVLQPVKAESETYYELKDYKMQSYTEDEKYEIPVEDGWENLEIKRRYPYDFPEP
ncbi:hypothetical protein ACK3SF_00565 [Candidatus Nanosalina sp. VS9-1]|uniref:hypothetical protein n=1 Tax=Candidatus Nanosalina sp. VS9-1 TaxID=3388566 RepID=UPI0039E1C237